MIVAGTVFGTYISMGACDWSQATNSCEDSPCEQYEQGPAVLYVFCVGGTPTGTCCECEELVRPCVGGGFGYDRTKGFEGVNPCTVVSFSPFQARCEVDD